MGIENGMCNRTGLELMSYRKRDILMAVVAIGLAVIAAASYFVPCGYAQKVTDHNWLVFYTYDGRTRLFWFDSTTHPFKIAHQWGVPRINILPEDADWPVIPWPDQDIVGPPPIHIPPRPQWETYINIAAYGRLPDFAFTWNTTIRTAIPGVTLARHGFVRFPLWIPAVLLIITPIRSAIRGPIMQRRRKKRGQCLHCGYNLTGNITGICSECGTEILA